MFMKKQRKEATFYTRMRPEVKKVLFLKAKNKGLSASDYLEQLILNRKIDQKDVALQMADMIEQVRRIGININQIARRLNGGIYDDVHGDLKKILNGQREIQNMVSTLYEDLNKPR